MSFLISIARIAKFTFQNTLRNFWLSFITMTVFLLTLVTINTVLFINVVADSVLQTIEQKVEITVYFTQNASEDLVKAAQGYVRGFSQVRDVLYVSEAEALANFQKRYSDDEVILSSIEEVGANPLGSSLVISAYSVDDLSFILQALETPEFSPYIKENKYTDYQPIIERISEISLQVKIFGFGLAGLFALIAMLIIFNTIRVAIYIHRDEIAIMKLVGANDWFVRGPFLLEALIYSIFASIIMVGLMLLFLQVARQPFLLYFGDSADAIHSYFFDNGLMIFGFECLGLSAVSLLTTGFAMRRYLRT